MDAPQGVTEELSQASKSCLLSCLPLVQNTSAKEGEDGQ